MLTEAGLKMLQKYIEFEANEGVFGKMKLVDAVMPNGTKAKALVLQRGSGAEKAIAKKLHNEGYAIFTWNAIKQTRLLIITDKGRKALTPSKQSQKGLTTYFRLS